MWAVSYTHLDVYKRQGTPRLLDPHLASTVIVALPILPLLVVIKTTPLATRAPYNALAARCV